MIRKVITALALILAVAFTSTAQEKTARTSFAWGSDVGVSIDMAGHDMSNINVNAYFGLKNRLFDILGVGAGIDMMMSNSTRAFPVYAIVRTSFGAARPLLFADLRGGIVFDNVASRPTSSRTYIAPGVGVNLAVGEHYRSYIILSYVYNDLRNYDSQSDLGLIRGLNFANVSIGITF